MVRLNLSELKEAAKNRPAGYLEEILKLGKPDGTGIFLKDSDYEFLVSKYAKSNSDGFNNSTENKAVPITTTASGKSENLNNINKDAPVLHVSAV